MVLKSKKSRRPRTLREKQKRRIAYLKRRILELPFIQKRLLQGYVIAECVICQSRDAQPSGTCWLVGQRESNPGSLRLLLSLREEFWAKSYTTLKRPIHQRIEWFVPDSEYAEPEAGALNLEEYLAGPIPDLRLLERIYQCFSFQNREELKELKLKHESSA